jgi:hypothetical protein
MNIHLFVKIPNIFVSNSDDIRYRLPKLKVVTYIRI